VQSIVSPESARSGMGGALTGRRGAIVVLGLAGSAILAITAATALPSGHQALARSAPLQVHPAQPAPPPAALASSSTAQAPDRDAAEPDTRRFTGVVGANFTQSLLTAGVPEEQGREYVAVLSHAIQLADGVSVADRFDLVVERLPSGKLGQVLYVGLDRVARADVELLKWTDGKNIIWVNADGVGGQDSSGISLPVHGRVSSGFGERFHPILGYVRFHKGVDLAAAAGTPIVAAADGRVVGAGWHGGYGQLVQIAHSGGLETAYGHMSRIAARAGEFVRKGEVIGYVGSTGLSTGPHLHFEVTRNGRPVNPMSVKMASGPGHLQGEKLHQFESALRGVLLGSARND
jgi:murein DD-endopeptidase MepM/ murein hydrolase activator NlpD